VTQRAIDALNAESRRLVDLAATFTAADWAAPSGCSGWRVQDVVCHMGCVFHSITDPSSIEPGPANDVEAAAEVPVQARRDWQAHQVVEYYEHWAQLGLDALGGMQIPPGADVEVPLGNLGSHPLHLLANALVFDHYCHIRHDIGAAIARAAQQPRDELALSETRLWMLAGIPQMCAEPLCVALSSPMRLVLEGPGGGAWVFEPAGEGAFCQIVEDPSGEVAATVTSDVHDFVSWGTRRSDWRDSNVAVAGDKDLAAAVLDAINVI
jgi:uncharacterized protein (TIGR03083 family)